VLLQALNVAAEARAAAAAAALLEEEEEEKEAAAKGASTKKKKKKAKKKGGAVAPPHTPSMPSQEQGPTSTLETSQTPTDTQVRQTNQLVVVSFCRQQTLLGANIMTKYRRIKLHPKRQKALTKGLH
jgi:hypothetical protein